MTDEHQAAIPVAIEQVVMQLSELEVALGPSARAVLPEVRAGLIDAMAARDRGDRTTVLARIRQAMESLAGLAEQLDPAEATLMRALARRFHAALLSGDQACAQESASAMFEKSGARERKKS